jgi:MoaA/NifB/PqqE/SkfB family radical SAM enzyme/glycosyltransferase involved in cell wall biosynthesis
MQKLAHLLLRTGFRESFNPGQNSWRYALEPLADAQEYALATPFAEILEAALQADAPYIVFADDATAIPDRGVETLLRVLRRNQSLPGLTFSTDALGKILGVAPQEVRTDAVRQSLIPLSRIPSWFSVINRRLLQLVEPREYQTLEFLLLELERRLADRGATYFRLDETLDFDPRYWVKDLLDHKARELAHDYVLYTQRHPASDIQFDVPSQFRVKVIGDFESVSESRPQPANGSGRPLFTVICPAYKPDFLREMVDSVLEQTYSDWELRILIDGPPEGHRRRIFDILEKHRSDPRIIVGEQENRGTGPTRRALAEAAQGEFVLSIDDDDMLVPETLEVFATAVTRHPEVDFFRGGAQMVGLLDRYHPPRARILVDGISADTFEVTQPFLIRTTTLASLGGFEGDESIKGAGEDTDLFLKIDRAGLRTVIIDRPLYRRRISLSNQSLSFVLPSALGHLETIDKRFTPRNWVLGDRVDEEDGLYSISILTYINLLTGAEAICPTRYFSYQTVGDTTDRAIDLEITSVCNAVCPFCPREVLADKNKHMPLATVRQIGEHLRREQGYRRRIVLCGIGEPTLHPHLEEIVTELAGVSSELCITTNGTLMSRQRFERLVECGLTEVNFSLNAFTPETHRRVMNLKNFEQVKANAHEIIRCRKERHPHVAVHVSFVYCNLNHHEAVSFADYWAGQSVTNVWIHPLNNRAGLLSREVTPMDTASLKERYAGDARVVVALLPHATEESRVCKIARDIDFISSDGSMRLCAMDYEHKTFFGSAELMSIQDMHLAKMLSYIRGENDAICAGCDFCPHSMERRRSALITPAQIVNHAKEARTA